MAALFCQEGEDFWFEKRSSAQSSRHPLVVPHTIPQVRDANVQGTMKM